MAKKSKIQAVTGKILRVFRPKRGVNPHKFNPEQYFKRYWYNRTDSEHVDLISRMEQISDKAATHMLQEYGFKYYIIKNILEEIDNLQQPENAIEQALMTRRIWVWRLYCRKHGVDPNTFNFLSQK